MSDRSDFFISAVDGTMETTPTKGIRAVASEYSISKSSAQCIIRVDLVLYPYKITLVQRKKPDDAERRLFLCDWFLVKFNSDPEFIDNLFESDESTFCLDGHSSSQNYRIWGLENPHAVRESKLILFSKVDHLDSNVQSDADWSLHLP